MIRSLLGSVALAPALAAALTAQATTFVPSKAIARFAADGVPQLLALLPKSGPGLLLAQAEVSEAFGKGLQRYRSMAARREAVQAYARGIDLELPWSNSPPGEMDGMRAVREIDLADLVHVSATAVIADDENMFPHTLVTLACKPRAEGRWTQTFERHAKELTGSKTWRAVADAKFDGNAYYQFERGDDAQAGNGQDRRVWLLHVPGLFAFGTGTPDQLGKLAPGEPAAPQVFGSMDMAAYVQMISRGIGALPPQFAAFGVGAMQSIEWRGSFAGDKVLDEIAITFADEPKGLVGAMLNGKAALPAQPLPEHALAQVRLAVDLELAIDALTALGGEALPEPIAKNVTKAFTGGVAIGAAAPARGGMIPRIFVSLAVADQKALDELLAMLPPEQKKQATYEDTPCTVVTIPGAPAAFQPAYCVLDGVLHIAESGQSLRAFLKARAGGGEAMDVGDAKEPEGAGERLATFDVRWDEAAIYRSYHEVWLPLLKLLPDEIKGGALVKPDEMPEPEAVLPLLGKGRGVLRRDGKTWRLQQLGTLGGVEGAAAAMTWGPILSAGFHHDYHDEELEKAVAKYKLGKVWEAIEAFEKANKRLPNDLGELVVQQKLADDALLMPGDPLAEPVALPAGDARTVKSSFRWFKDGVVVDDNGGNDVSVVLVSIKSYRWSRPMLAKNGVLPDVYGVWSGQPIDRFGK
ncbi:MAG TPA: hypothetical protein VF384_11945 [Planctomycetota bacterium]